YRDGLPFVFKHLPFHLASLIESTWLYAVPLLILIPLLSLIGKLTEMFRHYRRARWLEQLTGMQRLLSARQELAPSHLARLAKIRRALLGDDDIAAQCLRLLAQFDAVDTEHAASSSPSASTTLAIDEGLAEPGA